MKRVAVYARTSTQLQEQEKTIDSQIDAVKQFCEREKHAVVKTYSDDGWTGSILARPGLDQLRDDLSKGLFEAIVIYDQSRLSRKYAHFAILCEEFEDKGIEVIFLDSPTAVTPEDKILTGFKGLFAEYEKERIKERCRRGKLFKAKSGKLVGNEAPYGYRYIHKSTTEDGFYQVVEEEAEVVRKIFNWIGEDGCSLLEVKRRLYENKIPAQKSKSFIWSTGTLSRLIRRTDLMLQLESNLVFLLPVH